MLGERDAFCFVWLISVSTKPGFIGIAGPAQIPVFPSGEVPRRRHCKAAQVQPSVCRSLSGCSGRSDWGTVAGLSMGTSPWCLQQTDTAAIAGQLCLNPKDMKRLRYGLAELR